MRTVKNRARTLGLVAALALGPSANAAPDTAAKARYSLVNPKPADQLREMSTDRPDATESPFTVDAGRFQVELSFVDVSRDALRDGGRLGRAAEVAPTLLKLGVLDNMDLQLGIVPFAQTQLTDEGTGDTSTRGGFGDATFRVKVNLWGNDGGTTALAVMPFVKIPTAERGLGNGRVEGGLIVPFAVRLPHDLSLGFMPEFDVVEVDGSGRYSIDWVHTATLGFPIAGELGGFVEFAGAANLSREESYRRSFNAGLTYAQTPNVQFDGGIRVEATSTTDGWGAFFGVSWRH